MTPEYECLGPAQVTIAPKAAVMHWSHSVVHEKNFTPFWQAQQEASDLALELGFQECVRVDCFSLPPRKKFTRHHVKFCDEIQLFLGDEEGKEFRPVSLPHESLVQWDSKPWTLSPIPISTTSSLPAQQEGPDEPASHRSSRQGARPVPRWHQDIRTLLNEEAEEEEESDGKVLYVTSFFIDHQVHRFHDQPRILRFDEDHTEWENDARFIWEDLANPALDIDIIIIRPAPPFFAFRGTSATVIVEQRPQHDRAACLVTAVLPFSPDFRVITTAHSTCMELEVTQTEIIRLAGVEPQCHHRAQHGFGPCVLMVGLQELDPAHAVQVTSGLGLTIRVPPPMSEPETEQNVAVRYGTRDATPERAPTTAPEDTMSLMARRPRPVQASMSRASSAMTSSRSTSESTQGATSCSEDPPDTRRAVVFPVHGSPMSLLLPWNDGDALFQAIATAFEIPVSDVRDVHYVPHRPSDLALQELQGLIVQRIFEPRPSVFMRIVLVDVETYEDDLLQPSAFQRFPKWLPRRLDRPSILRMLDLAEIAAQYETQTKVWLNHCVVDSDQRQPLDLQDGDYIKIFIGNSECDHTRLSDVELPDVGSDFDLEDAETDLWSALQKDQKLLMKTLREIFDPPSTSRSQSVPFHDCKTTQWQPLSTTIHSADRDGRADPEPGFDRAEWQHDAAVRRLWSDLRLKAT